MLSSVYKPWTDVAKIHHSDCAHKIYVRIVLRKLTICILTPWESVRSSVSTHWIKVSPPRPIFVVNMMDNLRALAKYIVCHCWTTHSGNLVSIGFNWLAVLNTPCAPLLVDTTRFTQKFFESELGCDYSINLEWTTVTLYFMHLSLSLCLSLSLSVSLCLSLFPTFSLSHTHIHTHTQQLLRGKSRLKRFLSNEKLVNDDEGPPLLITETRVTSLDLEYRDENGSTALHLATLNGHRDVAYTLLQYSASINAKDLQG